MNRLLHLALITGIAALSIAGCGRNEPSPPAAEAPPPSAPAETPAPPPAVAEPTAAVTVGDIAVGNAIGADKKVTATPATLGRNDTIYASVDTTGSGSATLKARWTYLQPGAEPTVVNEETQTIQASGPATTEFHISKPDGWPAGEYQVELFVNDVSAGTRRFTVQ